MWTTQFLFAKSVLLALCGLLFGGGLVLESMGQPPTGNAKSGAKQAAKQTAAQRIEAVLDAPTSLEFVETPILDVIEYLEDHYKIPVNLDTKVLGESSVGTDTPINVHLKNISLRSALEITLDQLDLKYLVLSDALFITTRATASRRTSVREYDAGDLLAPDEPIAVLIKVLRASLIASGFMPQRKPHGGARQSATAKNPPPRAVRDGAYSGPLPSEVVSIDGLRNVLVIRASYHGHRTTEKLLAELRAKLTKVQAVPAARPVSPPTPGKSRRQQETD